MKVFLKAGGVNYPDYLKAKFDLIVQHRYLIREYLKDNKYNKTKDIDQKIDEAKKDLNNMINTLERKDTVINRFRTNTEVRYKDQQTQTEKQSINSKVQNSREGISQENHPKRRLSRIRSIINSLNCTNSRTNNN